MLKNYYDILGISESASEEDIKQAYRKLAREHHPDKGGDKEHFQKIQEAYEVLSNRQEQQNFSPFGFSQFFHHNNRQNIVKKPDNHYTCNISLKDVFHGVSKKFRVKRVSMCKLCKISCPICNGTGIVSRTIHLGPLTQFVQQPCGNCKSAGFIRHQSICHSCNSSGQIEENKIFEIAIPKGVQSGKQYCFENWGEQSNKPNEISGNFIVTIYVEQDNVFQRNNLDLIFHSSLSLKESILGKEITIPHFEKELSISTSGFGIINPHKQYTIFGKGLVDDSNNSGNLHIRFSINYPEIVLSDSQQKTLQSAFNNVGL
jgi:DnaJ-class molecular chaperone